MQRERNSKDARNAQEVETVAWSQLRVQGTHRRSHSIGQKLEHEGGMGKRGHHMVVIENACKEQTRKAVAYVTSVNAMSAWKIP